MIGILERLKNGPASVGELVRAGATEDEIHQLIDADLIAILQFSDDNDALIVGAYK